MLNELTSNFDLTGQTHIPAPLETPPPRFKVYNERHLDRIPQLQKLSATQRFNMSVVAHVLPFRINPYVIENLIDWGQYPR